MKITQNHEANSLTKFRKDRAKVKDFLLMLNLWKSRIYFRCIRLQVFRWVKICLSKKIVCPLWMAPFIEVLKVKGYSEKLHTQSRLVGQQSVRNVLDYCTQQEMQLLFARFFCLAFIQCPLPTMIRTCGQLLFTSTRGPRNLQFPRKEKCPRLFISSTIKE